MTPAGLGNEAAPERQRGEVGTHQARATQEGKARVDDPGAAPFQPSSIIPRRVLLIDDHPALRRCVARIIQSAGYVVEEAGSGEEGLRRLQGARVDMVITDLRMPGLSGWDVARAARVIRPSVPVVLMTACLEAPEAGHEAADLVAGILIKPFRAEEILSLIAGLERAREMEA